MSRKGNTTMHGAGGLTGVLLVLVLLATTLVGTGIFSGAALADTSNITLGVGWNLISLPLIPTDATIANVLTSVSSNVNSVWAYDANSGLWQSWNPILGGDLAVMTDGFGYWIDMAAARTLTITGTVQPGAPAAPASYAVATGWNLLGFKEISTMQVGTYLGGTDFRCPPIYGYGGGSWVTISTNTTLLQPGSGYWIYFNTAGVVTP
jgi:hypothetical protein